MTEPPAATATGTVPIPPARLEPDAIGVAQDTVIGMANSAPAVSVGLTLAALAAAGHCRGRPDPDAGRPIHPALPVLPDPHGKRHAESLTRKQGCAVRV